LTKEDLVRLSAVAAIAGGALRVADGLVIASTAPQVQQLAYFVTDFLLLFGVCGVYLPRSQRLGVTGLAGFVLSFLGILMVRSLALNLFGFSAYLVGASVTLFGAVAIGMAMLWNNAFPKWAPILWMLSLIFGVIGLFPFAITWGVTAAGVTFGAGFIAAGISLFSQAPAGEN
jgi:hypothetical protein